MSRSLASFETNFGPEMKAIEKKLEKLSEDVHKEGLKKMRKAGQIARDAARANLSSKTKNNTPTKRYDAAGNHVATYYPGNLKRSIRVLPLRKAKFSVHIGAFMPKRNSRGDFRGNRVDGWYAHFVERGTAKTKHSGYKFMDKAFNQTNPIMKAKILNDLKDIVEAHDR